MRVAAWLPVVILPALFLAGCASTAFVGGGESSAYREFKARADYPETDEVYRDPKLLAK